MVAIPYLFGCVFAVAQLADHGNWVLLPRLSRGQELVYRGVFAEEATGKGVQFSRNHRLEARVFVLGTPPGGAEVAFLTVLKQRTAGGRSEGPEPSSVRLEVAQADLQGRLTAAAGSSLTVPLAGPPTAECGAFVELPQGHVSAGKTWTVPEFGRPSLTWRMAGTEIVAGTSCFKLTGLQQSDDWDHPRADHAAWRRLETVWLSPRHGIAYRVERVIERREPAHLAPSQRSVTRYELESSLQYPGQLFDDRQREILLARDLYAALAPLLPEPAKQGPQPFDRVLARINAYLNEHPYPTPYREAILQVRRRAEAAKRGESPPPTVPDSDESPVTVATLEARAPDFLAPNLLTGQSATLHSFLGAPVLLVFYSPQAPLTPEVLRFAQTLNESHLHPVHVVGLPVADNSPGLRKQYADLGLTFPLLAGKGLCLLYNVEVTPRLVVLDADGVVRGLYAGWGQETPRVVRDELQRWARPVQPARTPAQKP
jgi:peroxiredoxin